VADGSAVASVNKRTSGSPRRGAHPQPRLRRGTWLSIQVELIEGRGEDFWPRPGRVFAAAAKHSFGELARAIDDAFARWDLSHMHEFQLEDGSRVGLPDPDFDPEEAFFDERVLSLARLKPGDKFSYVFDFGDDWAHLCTVGSSAIDPLRTLGLVPDRPLPYFGWGHIPDQYGRTWSGDDGESRPPPDPQLRDLPPLRPGWGGTRPNRNLG
jgi:hypothetical protein